MRFKLSQIPFTWPIFLKLTQAHSEEARASYKLPTLFLKRLRIPKKLNTSLLLVRSYSNVLNISTVLQKHTKGFRNTWAIQAKNAMNISITITDSK
jgi:hypothetical protein